MQSKISIDNVPKAISPNLYTGQQLQTLANLPPGRQLCLEIKEGHVLVPIASTDYIYIDGGESFITQPIGHEIPENPTLKKPIGFQLNEERFEGRNGFQKAKNLVKDILARDKESDACDKLEIVVKGLPVKPEALLPDAILIVHQPIKFITQPAGNCGDSNLAHTNPILDKQFNQVLELFPDATLQADGSNGHCMVIPNYGLPNHWSKDKTDLLIHVPQGYPQSPLDMFWVLPSVTLRDGNQPKNGDSTQSFLGMTWQRFSWHYKSRRWDHRKDNLMSHIQFCHKRLLQQA